MIVNIILELFINVIIKRGVNIFYVILFINMMLVIIVYNIKVVFRLFCNRINVIGIMDIFKILKNNIKLDWKDLLNVNWLCLDIVLVKVSISIIFMNLEGWMFIGLKLY